MKLLLKLCIGTLINWVTWYLMIAPFTSWNPHYWDRNAYFTFAFCFTISCAAVAGAILREEYLNESRYK